MCCLFQSAINVYVNRLNSIESVIQYEYHSFDVCTLWKEAEEKFSPSNNLGQDVFGERIRPSPYKVCASIVHVHVYCHYCGSRAISCRGAIANTCTPTYIQSSWTTSQLLSLIKRKQNIITKYTCKYHKV